MLVFNLYYHIMTRRQGFKNSKQHMTLDEKTVHVHMKVFMHGLLVVTALRNR